MGALWLAGVAMRMTILAMPPVIPLVHAELRMTETQVGLLVGLPLLLFAVAAIPGSLLIARIGPSRAVLAGMVIAAVAGAARGVAIDVWTLYAAALATGFGVAIMQPSMPVLVREWTPNRIALGTIAYTSGMMMGATFPPLFTLSTILPHVGGSWRLNLVVWAVPALLIAPVFLLLSPKRGNSGARENSRSALWWPDFRDPLVWLLGLTFGCNNSPYFAINAFLGDYVAARGRADLLGPTLTWLNGSQIVALVLLFALAGRLQRRAWPFLIFGPALLAAMLVDNPRADRPRAHRCGGAHRFRNGDDVYPDHDFGADPRQTRRCRAHRRRHAHHRLCLRDRHSDDLRRAVGCDRRAVDGVRAALPLRRGIDGARRDSDEVSAPPGEASAAT